MNGFKRIDGVVCAGQVPLTEIAAQFGTPAYVYSRASIESNWHDFDDALGTHPHLICYAVKANSSLAILNVMARMGSGFDIVSVGELERVIAAQGDPGKVVFSGVGKRVDEIERALEAGILCFNVESEAELVRINEVAVASGRPAPVAMRINPDIDAGTHPYISTGLKASKFGVDIEAALPLYRRAAGMPGLKVIGLDCHIGSQIVGLKPFVDALERLLVLAQRLADDGIVLNHLDVGGGLGIAYHDEVPPSPAGYAAALLDKLQHSGYDIILEPGRAITGNAGVLLTRVELLKPGGQKNFAVVDAAMNDLVRPALYQAWQDIEPVVSSDAVVNQWDVVGPVCETGDFLGKDRELAIRAGDLLCVHCAGAYGFSMASQYNSRPRAAEIMVDGEQAYLIRGRESVASLFAGESLLP